MEKHDRRPHLVQTLTKGGIRARFRNLAGNEIAPAGMQWGCPANWIVSQVLQKPRWIQLGNSAEHGSTKLEKRYAPGHIDGYNVLEKNQTPTHILVNGKSLSIADGRTTFLGEGEITDDGIIWLQTVVSPDSPGGRECVSKRQRRGQEGDYIAA